MRLSINPDDGEPYIEYCKLRDKKYAITLNGIPQPHSIACETGRIGGWVERYVTVDGKPDGDMLVMNDQPQTERVYGCVEVKFEDAMASFAAVASHNSAQLASLPKCLTCLTTLVCGACPKCAVKVAGGGAGFNPLQVHCGGRFNGMELIPPAPSGFDIVNPFCGFGAVQWNYLDLSLLRRLLNEHAHSGRQLVLSVRYHEVGERLDLSYTNPTPALKS